MKDVYSAAKKLKMERVKQVQFSALPEVCSVFSVSVMLFGGNETKKFCGKSA